MLPASVWMTIAPQTPLVEMPPAAIVKSPSSRMKIPLLSTAPLFEALSDAIEVSMAFNDEPIPFAALKIALLPVMLISLLVSPARPSEIVPPAVSVMVLTPLAGVMTDVSAISTPAVKVIAP